MSAATWDTERAAKLAREAYRYVARTYPPDAPLEPLGRADMAVLEAQAAGDWQGYEESLRELCRVARREAMSRQKVGEHNKLETVGVSGAAGVPEPEKPRELSSYAAVGGGGR